MFPRFHDIKMTDQKHLHNAVREMTMGMVDTAGSHYCFKLVIASRSALRQR